METLFTPARVVIVPLGFEILRSWILVPVLRKCRDGHLEAKLKGREKTHDAMCCDLWKAYLVSLHFGYAVFIFCLVFL